MDGLAGILGGEGRAVREEAEEDTGEEAGGGAVVSMTEEDLYVWWNIAKPISFPLAGREDFMVGKVGDFLACWPDDMYDAYSEKFLETVTAEENRVWLVEDIAEKTSHFSLLEKLSRHRKPEVRFWAASNPLASVDMLERLAEDDSDTVSHAAKALLRGRRTA